ncbi:glycosyltransferase [Hydrogenophaga atypica]|uniref:Glycosyltransferase n=1 Tax=Hydrogenophaga atypica TaxID=249409 RepID=A0ABW2QFN4_9BURK
MNTAENASRLYKEAAYTLKNGICRRVVVLAFWNEGLARNETTTDGLEIKRLPTVLHRYKNAVFLRRFVLLRKVVALLSLFQYAFDCIQTTRRLNPDHVSCHNAFMLPVAWAAARSTGATLEYLPHELETERAGLKGMFKRITTLIERRFIRSARNVVVVCEPIHEWYRSTYELDNVYVVRNVPEQAAVQVRPVPEGSFRERFNIPEAATLFIYQGQISIGRGIDELIDVFSRLEPTIAHIVFMGYTEGGYKDILGAAVQAHSNIHFQPAVPRDQIVSYSAGADVGIFVVPEVPLNDRFALPNKFFEWSHAGLPMLFSDNLEYLSGLAREGSFGWSCRFEEVESKILEICDTDLEPFVESVRRFAAPAVWDQDAKIFAHIYRQPLA